MKMRRLIGLVMIAAAASASAAWASLAANMDALPSNVLPGQSFTVVMHVINNGSLLVNGITAQAYPVQSGFSASLSSGPYPASQNLAATASGDFTWVYSGSACGDVYFSGSASGSDSGGPQSVNAAPSSSVHMVCTTTPTPTLGTPSATPTASPTASPIIIFVTVTPPPAQGSASIPGNIFHPLQGGTLSLNYSLPYAGQLSISIYNRNGVKLKGIQVDSPAGSFSQAWDGRGDDGEILASGIYVAVFRGKGLNRSVKLVIIK
jgi:hypothetical protein